MAFTATQIPGIAGRVYPAELAGPLYPRASRSWPRRSSSGSSATSRSTTVVFAYSDVAHETVMHAASRVLAAGADFVLLGPDRDDDQEPPPGHRRRRHPHRRPARARRPATSAELLTERGLKPVVIRHPMPYGDLVAQRVQRFATYADLDRTRPPSRSARSTSRTSTRA